MSTMFITEPSTVLSLEGGYFKATQRDGLVRKFPKETLDAITIFGNASLTVPCVQECLRKGVTVNYFSGKGRYYGRLASTGHGNPNRIRQQVYACDDTAFCLAFSKSVVDAKIQNQMVVLRRYQRSHGAPPEPELANMKAVRHRLEQASSVNEVMGLEGIAARSYFAALAQLVEPAFRFKGRSRQPPRDAFNSMLSLGYTLLLYELYAEIENRGLNPYLSFLHTPHPGHPALASDLMEEWRAPVVDSAVLALVQGHEILADQFETDEETGGILIKPDGMKLLLKKLEKKFSGTVRYLKDTSCTLRYCFYLQTVDLARALEARDASLYCPVLIR